MIRFPAVLAILLLCLQFAGAQSLSGTVKDADIMSTLPGATVRLIKDTTVVSGAVTTENGRFNFTALSPGRYTLVVSFIGYETSTRNGIQVYSGRETNVEVLLSTSFTEIETFEISATGTGRETDEMATVSSRAFVVDETERYAGSRGDPARMVSGYAGVQSSDDSRNDIVVRGNSPAGVLYRLEGIDIPNPNHFAVAGTMGGPVSIINNKVLGTSEFYMSAFPSRFGNATSAVFDLKMRNGSTEKTFLSGQLGFLGTELTAEGPLSKSGRTSYLANFRYSTLKLFESVNFKIGTEAVPSYKDGAFKIHHGIKNGSIDIFGMGGSSSIDIIVSEIENPEDEIYGDKNRDQYFRTAMGVGGISLARTLGKKSMLRTVAAVSTSRARSYHDFITWDTTGSVTSISPILGYELREHRVHGNLYYTLRSGNRHVIQSGLLSTAIHANYIDSNLNVFDGYFVTRLSGREWTYQLQPFVQIKYDITEHLEATAGLHALYFDLNHSFSLEPRAGMRYQPSNRHTFSLGLGLHSQLQPMYIYFHEVNSHGAVVRHNKDLGPTRAAHSVLGYEFKPSGKYSIRTELYSQWLYDVPVTVQPSSFSMINAGTGFSRIFPDSLVNEGTGLNYGFEVTFERYLNKSFFLMATGTLYQSRYQGSDKQWRDSDFNGNYMLNVLTGKEFKVKKNNVLQLGVRVTYAGNRRYGPVDVAASARKGETVYVDSTTNTLQFPPYFRADLKFSYRMNREKTGHEIGIDLVNIFNVQNVLALSYIPDPVRPSANPVKEEYQLGFLPLFYYRIDWSPSRKTAIQ